MAWPIAQEELKKRLNGRKYAAVLNPDLKLEQSAQRFSNEQGEEFVSGVDEKQRLAQETRSNAFRTERSC